ncbi:hypothetical protein KAURM247S_03116 [Kitasatospora aureofaciens]
MIRRESGEDGKATTPAMSDTSAVAAGLEPAGTGPATRYGYAAQRASDQARTDS